MPFSVRWASTAGVSAGDGRRCCVDGRELSLRCNRPCGRASLHSAGVDHRSRLQAAATTTQQMLSARVPLDAPGQQRLSTNISVGPERLLLSVRPETGASSKKKRAGPTSALALVSQPQHHRQSGTRRRMTRTRTHTDTHAHTRTHTHEDRRQRRPLPR